MVINAQGNNQAQPADQGTALLLAAAPVGKGCLIDAAAVLPALAAVPPSALTGTPAATVVELADPLDPQAVLTRIRTAAALPGQLHVYVTGQLHLDHRQHLLHLALARTTPSTLRYTALPWHWLTGELALRRPHTTTVVLDLVADADAWPHVRGGGVGLGHGIRVFGRVTPPPPRRTLLTPDYLRTYADIWRTGARPHLAQLHETAAGRSGPAEALFVAMDTPVGAFAPGGAAAPVHGAAAAAAGVPVAQPARAGTTAVLPPQSAPAGVAVVPLPQSAPAGTAAVPLPQGAPAGTATVPMSHGMATGAVPVMHQPPTAPSPPPLPTAEPSPAPADRIPAPAHPPAEPEDPHPAMLAAAQAGRHAEAAAIAARWESEALRIHGAGSAQAVHWLEVRADLARLAQDPGRSCALWAEVARARLARGEAASDDDVEAAVDRAHHQWEQLGDPGRARALAVALTELRGQVPGRRPGALKAIQRRLDALGTPSPLG
ncbi:hypothetical protein [Streptomyces sp. NPDC059639]|uniref:hypothetical protein n=1 Tax=Streptomyces sp. NPDC059639 TaxID=3346891 RepID=UPI003697F92E